MLSIRLAGETGGGHGNATTRALRPSNGGYRHTIWRFNTKTLIWQVIRQTLYVKIPCKCDSLIASCIRVDKHAFQVCTCVLCWTHIKIRKLVNIVVKRICKLLWFIICVINDILTSKDGMASKWCFPITLYIYAFHHIQQLVQYRKILEFKLIVRIKWK